MPTLIENILSLEYASETVASARVRRTRTRGGPTSRSRRRGRVGGGINAAGGAGRRQPRCGRDVSGVETEFQAAYASIDGISSAAIQEHAAKIAAAFAQGRPGP